MRISRLSIAWILILCGSSGALAANRQVEGIAAVVGDDVILRSEVQLAATPALTRIASENGGTVPPDVHRQIYHQAVQSVIDSRLLGAAAQRMNMETTPEEVDRTVNEIAEQEGLTTEQLYSEVEAQGLSRDQYRQEIAAQLTKMRVISTSVRSRVTVSEAEIEALFAKRYAGTEGRRVRLRHILIPWPPPDSDLGREHAIEIAEEIRDAAQSGQDFARLARRYSAAPSAENGGLMSLEEGTAVAALAGPAFSLAPGEISPVIETQHGANLIQVLERFDPGEVEYESVREALHRELLDRASQPEIEKFMKELREESYVEIIAPDFK